MSKISHRLTKRYYKTLWTSVIKNPLIFQSSLLNLKYNLILNNREMPEYNKLVKQFNDTGNNNYLLIIFLNYFQQDFKQVSKWIKHTKLKKIIRSKSNINILNTTLDCKLYIHPKIQLIINFGYLY